MSVATDSDMRISDEMTYRVLSSGISSSKQSIFQLQQQISTGRRVLQPSDDPGSYEMITRLNDDLANIQQYTKNAERLETDLTATDNTLQSMTSLFQRIQEITIKGGDATISDSDRVTLGKEADGLLTQLIDMANLSEGGRYVYAGLRTDTKPYTGTDTDADGMIDTITYSGSDQTRQVEIGRGVYVEANIVGSSATSPNAMFQTSSIDLFQTIIDLRDNLMAGNNTSQTTDLDQTNKGLNHILSMISTVGARQEQVTISKDLLSQRETNIQSSLDTEQSLDIAKAMTELAERQLSYQAALKSTTLVLNQQRLMDML